MKTIILPWVRLMRVYVVIDVITKQQLLFLWWWLIEDILLDALKCKSCKFCFDLTKFRPFLCVVGWCDFMEIQHFHFEMSNLNIFFVIVRTLKKYFVYSTSWGLIMLRWRNDRKLHGKPQHKFLSGLWSQTMTFSLHNIK